MSSNELPQNADNENYLQKDAILSSEKAEKSSHLKKFLNFSSDLTHEYQKDLHNKQSVFFNDQPNKVSLLMLENSGISAQARPSHGIVGIEKHLLNIPEKIEKAVLIHEKIHLNVSSEIRQAVFSTDHQEIHKFFHQNIIPKWIENEVEIHSNQDYLKFKGWSGLYPDWNGPLDVTKEKAIKTMDNYFNLFQKKAITIDSQGNFIHASPKLRSWEQVLKKTNQNLMDQFREDPQKFILILETGYELMDYLQTAYREALSSKTSLPIWELEEGFANYVGSTVANISLNEMNTYAPQDAGKILLAEKIIDKKPDIQEALLINSFDDLIKFYQQLKLI